MLRARTRQLSREQAQLLTVLAEIGLCDPAAEPDEQTEVVCQRLLPQAGRLTIGELAARIKKLAIALDPEWAARQAGSSSCTSPPPCSPTS